LSSTATPPLSVSQALVTTGSLAGTMQVRDQVIQGTLLPQLNELADSLTNTQVLSATTGLSATSKVSGAQSFVLTVVPSLGVGNVKNGQTISVTVNVAAGSSVQNVVDDINSAVANVNVGGVPTQVAVAPFIHASLNAAGQLQVDTIAQGTLVKIDQASVAASKDFGFSTSVADGFNMVHVQGYGLDTPAQITGGISGLTLDTAVNTGGANDGLTITGPDGQTFTVVVPAPVAPKTQVTVQDLITAINGSGLSHGVQAGLDDSGRLVIYAAPTQFGPGGQVLGQPAQLVGTAAAPVDQQATVFAGGATLQIKGPNGTQTFTTAANETVGQFIQLVNAANLGVNASLDSLGRFQLTSALPGAGQTFTATAAGAGTDVTGTLGLSAAVGGVTLNGLDRGFMPSSTITLSAPTGNTQADFLGSPAGTAGPPPPYVISQNTNQLFFKGASQTLPGQVLPSSINLAAGATTTFNGATPGLVQPVYPGQLALTLSGATSFGQVTVSGTDVNGNVVQDILNFAGNGTLTTLNSYKSITSITVPAAGNNSAMFGVQSLALGTEFDTAGALVVDANIQKDPTVIAASSAPGAAGNATNGLALLNVQQTAIIGAGQTASTIGDFYAGNTAQLGAAASAAHTEAQSQTQLVQHLQNAKQSVVGVSLDEEASNLVALQHAYEAAARALTTQDSMLNTIINGMGLVGLAGSGG
jgi:flagellar hook-associated protein FlgK